MQEFESIKDAMRVAREVLSGTRSPTDGCGLIASISKKLNEPPELQLFSLLSHEQYGHEQIGITAASCTAEILNACRQLVESNANGSVHG